MKIKIFNGRRNKASFGVAEKNFGCPVFLKRFRFSLQGLAARFLSNDTKLKTSPLFVNKERRGHLTLSRQDHFLRLGKGARFQSVEIHAAHQARRIERHLITPRLEIVFLQHSHLSTQHVEHLQ